MRFSAINFTCASCGAPQKFSPATGSLRCEFCGTQSHIDIDNHTIEEYDFTHALQNLTSKQHQEINKEVSCTKCGADFTLTPYSFSSNCPFCDTPAIVDFIREIAPESLIPFRISQKEALSRFKQWVGSRWFAPNAFKKYLDGDQKLTGYYLPYWTYDSDTITPYTGKRGDIYYVTVTKTIVENGRQRRIQVQEPRIRWTPVSGTVQVSFDDITIGASKTISRAILDSLEPWNTTTLVPFDEKYLLGFEAEEYTIGLDNAFEYAKAKMTSTIRYHIRREIGGDQQQIISMQPQYHNVTYKNILLPIWTASFKWKNKTYHYAINAQTGKVAGQRPYSITKILLAILLAAGILGGLAYLSNKNSNTSPGISYEISY